jgi:DNA ligase-1
MKHGTGGYYMIKKPLLAAKVDPVDVEQQLTLIKYPVMASPKVDGIRVLAHPQLGPVTRKLKLVPNKYIRYTFMYCAQFSGLDGEITVGEPNIGDVFNRTTRGVMSREGNPDFTFHVFDDFTQPGLPYAIRQLEAERKVRTGDLPWLKVLPFKFCGGPQDLLEYEAECLEQGYEGICWRDPNGPYKEGRSTFNQGILFKLKRVLDDEAQIIDVEQRYRNDNEATKDNLGYQVRSAHQANLTPLEMVGRLICKSPKFAELFGVGSGFDHQPHGTLKDGKPRHPIFKGFRRD